MHRYYLDRSYTGGSVRPLPYPRWDRSVPAELRYPYDVLELALPKVHAEGLHFYFTKSAYLLPEYGPHVVAVLLQEERCKVPVYGHHVRATIRNLESQPALCWRPHEHLGRLEMVLSFEFVRDWYTHFLSATEAHRRALEKSRVREEAALIRLPLGYHSQEALPQVPMIHRPLDAFFAGEIRHPLPVHDYRRFTSTSKFVARAQLWSELERLAHTGRWRLDLGRTSASDPGARAFGSYSDKMMHTRVCLAPRGSVAETYRAFEGLRAGCLVVANRLPTRSPLARSPVLQIDHWGELEGILEDYAHHLDRLEAAHTESIGWWNAHGAISVQAGYVARALNRAGDTLSLSA